MQNTFEQRQMAEFHSRISRIQNPKNTSYVDPETGIIVPKRLNANQSIARNSVLFPFALVMSLILGVAAVGLSRYVRYYVLGMNDGDVNPDVAVAMDLALAGAVVLALKSLMKLEGRAMSMMQALGIVAAVGFLHNAVWAYPEMFTTVYSGDYVAMVQSTTEPNTVLFRGTSIPLDLGTINLGS